jgi:hypothetical protein
MTRGNVTPGTGYVFELTDVLNSSSTSTRPWLPLFPTAQQPVVREVAPWLRRLSS